MANPNPTGDEVTVMTLYPITIPAAQGTLVNWAQMEEDSWWDHGAPGEDALAKCDCAWLVKGERDPKGVHPYIMAGRKRRALVLKTRQEAERAAKSLEYFGDAHIHDQPQYATRAAMRRLARKIRNTIDQKETD
jgi:hypothetical protein